ncbi:CD1247 N-terminal domain-containing protein [Brevibacillus sp. B_LB10_24]|jgi:hypothetical protein|uniref:CD1247 N-terminal domain-containing protein n=1 Tax=Brevibacillus TaxID=55080 RepID=UPI0002E6F44C|nr:CD1247 N-terminal domain-containing protein [Brevibacillus massiliensis]
MEHLQKRISYLRGLAEGMDVSGASREGKMIGEIIEVLDDFYGQVRDLQARVEETEVYVEAIDEDLSDLEYMLQADDEALYEIVEDDEDAESAESDFYDLDDSEDANVYASLDNRGQERSKTGAGADGTGAEYEITHVVECPNCHETLLLLDEVDTDGYRHYIIEPYNRLEPINPT